MLFKLSVKNIKNSLRDYSVYFLTLVIGVMIFYSFNAIGGSKAFSEIAENHGKMADLLLSALSGVSIFVAVVLGMLIVYASRFLMKRRNKEFALYMILGMGKSQVSRLLLIETLIIGTCSLFVGIIFGIGLSQLMGIFVIKLFSVDMTFYSFAVSGAAIRQTIICFLIMYVVVMLFNGGAVTRMKLIDLIQSGKKSEKIKMKNPVVCLILFTITAFILGYCYYKVGWKSTEVTYNEIFLYVIIGAISTFLMFWSVSGMLLRVVMFMKKRYFSGLNSFTFRQISSKVNTVVMSMTIICLMLFFTICMLSSAFSLRNGMNSMVEKCNVDFSIKIKAIMGNDKDTDLCKDVVEAYSESGADLPSYFESYAHYHDYIDESMLFSGSKIDAIPGLIFAFDINPVGIMKVSDFNDVMAIYGNEGLELAENEFVMLCNYQNNSNIYNDYLEKDSSAVVFGHELTSKMNTVKTGAVELSGGSSCTGIMVVPDSIVDEKYASEDHFIGNYKAANDQEKLKIEEELQKLKEKVDRDHGDYALFQATKIEITESTLGIGALATIIGLYLGMIFLIASGAILSLRELSDSVDSVQRYAVLRKIGVEEKEISRSLFRQTGIFFLLPLILAIIHSYFGIKYASVFIKMFGTEGILMSMSVTILVILLIYGGYFAVSYFGSKRIIRGNV